MFAWYAEKKSLPVPHAALSSIQFFSLVHETAVVFPIQYWPTLKSHHSFWPSPTCIEGYVSLPSGILERPIIDCCGFVGSEVITRYVSHGIIYTVCTSKKCQEQPGKQQACQLSLLPLYASFGGMLLLLYNCGTPHGGAKTTTPHDIYIPLPPDENT